MQASSNQSILNTSLRAALESGDNGLSDPDAWGNLYILAGYKAHVIYTTSYQRRCNVMTLHRRWYDVVSTLHAHWERLSLPHLYETTEIKVIWLYVYRAKSNYYCGKAIAWW